MLRNSILACVYLPNSIVFNLKIEFWITIGVRFICIIQLSSCRLVVVKQWPNKWNARLKKELDQETRMNWEWRIQNESNNNIYDNHKFNTCSARLSLEKEWKWNTSTKCCTHPHCQRAGTHVTSPSRILYNRKLWLTKITHAIFLVTAFTIFHQLIRKIFVI